MGQMGTYGTGAFNLVLDTDAYKNMESVDVNRINTEEEIDEMFGNLEDKGDSCAKQNIQINNNISAIKQNDKGDCDDDYDIGF